MSLVHQNSQLQIASDSTSPDRNRKNSRGKSGFQLGNRSSKSKSPAISHRTMNPKNSRGKSGFRLGNRSSKSKSPAISHRTMKSQSGIAVPLLQKCALSASAMASQVPEGHHPRGTTLREALRGHLPLRGLCGGLSEGSAGVSPRVLRGSAVRGIFRGFSGVVTLYPIENILRLFFLQKSPREACLFKGYF